MNGNSDQIRSKLSTKIVNTMLAIILVLGLSPLSKASASVSSDSNQQNAEQIAQQTSGDQGESTDTSAGSGTSADTNTAASDAVSNAASSTSADQSAENLAGGGASGAVTSGNAASNNAPAQQSNGSNSIAVQAESSGNPAPVTEGVSVGFYKTKNSDGTLSDPLGENESITTDQTLYGQIDITFVDSERPTVDRPSVSYQLPSNIKVAAQTMPLLDGGKIVGETVIDENGLVTLKYTDMEYLKNEVKDAKFKFSFTLDGDPKGDGGEEKVNFTGASEVTFKTKDGGVSASKFGGNINESWNGPKYDASTNSFTWTIKVTPETYATNLVVSDTIGSNLEFVKDSFKLVDANGNDVSGTCNVNFKDDSNADISLGDLPRGTYYIQYKTTVKQSALDSLGNNTELGNVNNTAHWAWGSADNRKSDNGSGASSNPQSTKYSMVSKSADGNESTNEKIKWVVKLNNGNIKADMDGYHFLDEVGNDQDFVTTEGFTVTVDGKTIEPSVTENNEKKLEFILPEGIGKQQVEIVYYTKMKNPSSKDSVSNTAKITVDDQSRPDGEWTGTYTPKDNDTYIEKALTSDIDPDTYDGKASWTSTINFGAMSESTKPESVKFWDYFSALPGNAKVRLAGDVVVTFGGKQLEEGVDYAITKNTNEVGCWSHLFEIAFKDSEMVRGLIESSDAKVTVSYSTETTQVDGVYPTGRYANRSSVQTNKVKEKFSEASYETSHDLGTPSVKKKCNSVSWNQERESWIVSWEVHVNCYEPNSWTHSGVGDLKGQDVVIFDELPEKMTYVDGSNRYWLMPNDGYKKGGDWPVLKDESPVIDNESNRITFTLKTDSVVDDSGSWIGYVNFQYQTEVKASDIPAGTSPEFTNSAHAKSGDIEFPSGSDTVKIENKVLSKTGNQPEGDPLVTYTIDVNENGLTLNGGKDLALSDVMDPNCNYAGDLQVLNLKDSTLLDEAKWSKSFTTEKNEVDGSLSTKMTLTLPDATPLRIVYKVSPLGSLGENVPLKNSCELNGGNLGATEATGGFKVIAASSETSNTKYGIDITKYNASMESRLSNAEFTLYKVSSFGDDDSPVLEKVESKLTGEDGKVTFGDKETPLNSNTLYCFKETKAPAGYKISQEDPAYFVIKGTDEKAFQQVVENATSHKAKPTVSTSSFTVTDEESDTPTGSATLSLKKTVNGNAPADGQDFEFKLSAVTDGAPMPPESGTTVATSGADAEKSFGEISFDTPGTYKYKIEETFVAPNDGNVWTMASPVYAQVTVGAAEDGKLPTSVKYYSDEDCTQELSGDKALFNNTYTAPASAKATVKVHKTVEAAEGANVNADEQFEFALYKANDQGIKTDEKVGDSIKVKKGGDGSFGELSFDAEGTYNYVISEIGHNDKGWTAPGDVKVQVVVKRSDDGQSFQVKSITYGGEKAECASFVDVYAASSVEASLSAKKAFEGGFLADGQFSFKLKQTSAPEGVSFDERTASNDASGDVSFGPIKYDKAGTYEYEISEAIPADAVNGAKDGIAYDLTAHKAKVIVSDNGKGQLVASVTYDGDKSDIPTFTNKKQAPAECSASINITKTVNGSTKVKADEDFSFQLFGADAQGEATGGQVGKTVTVKPGQKVPFDAITFDKEGTYNYVIHEEGHSDKGWIAHADVPVSITVTKDATENKLNAVVNYDEGKDAVVVDDTYQATGSATLSVKKLVNGADPAAGQSFSFSLSRDASDQASANAPMPEETKATTVGSAPASFGEIGYTLADAGKTYKYTISETTPATVGWTMADPVTATVKVGEDNGDGTLKPSTVEYSNANAEKTAALFNNVYEQASGEFQLQIEKTVNGAVPSEGQAFKFKAASTDEGAPDLGEATTGADGKAAFSFGGLGDSYEGKTFTYTISEELENGGGWTKAADVKAKVEIGKRGADNKLHPTVTYQQAGSDEWVSGPAKFDNKYEHASGEFQLGLVKTVNGNAPAEGQSFEFSAAPTDKSDQGAPTFENVTTDAKGSASFAAAKLSDKDSGKTYVYRIHEETKLQSDFGVWEKADDVIATVKVGPRGEDNRLPVTVTYQQDGSDAAYGNAAQFNNTYREIGGSFQLALVKSVEGKALDRPFEFKAEAVGENADGAPKLESDTVSSSAETGKASFGEAKLTAADRGKTYTYKISETSKLDAAWAKAADVYAHVAVSNELNDDGDLTATVTYSADEQGADPYTGAAKFTNRYTQASGEFQLGLVKTVNGSVPAEGQSFKFKAASTDEGAPELGEIETDKEGRAAFSFDGLDDSFEGKEFAYTISEELGNGNGWTKAADVKAKVVVGQRGADNKFHPTVTYQQAGSDEWTSGPAKFNNTYQATGSAVLSLKKLVNGGSDDPTGSTFSFQLKQQDGTVVSEATAKAGETASFQPIDYTLADVGKTFTYTISEVGGNDGAWFAAGDVTATVEVSDNEDGTLATKVSYSGSAGNQAAALFDNAYAPASAELLVKKTVNGGKAPADTHFTFQLQPQDGAPAPAEDTADTFGGDTCGFGAIEFTEPGEYRYAIHETSDLGEGWTNAADASVTVKVVRDEQARTLKVESIDYGDRAYAEDGQQMALFDNKYEQPEQPEEATPQQPGSDTPDSDQPSDNVSSGVKTGDSLALAGGALAVIALVAAGIAAFALRRRKN